MESKYYIRRDRLNLIVFRGVKPRLCDLRWKDGLSVRVRRSGLGLGGGLGKCWEFVNFWLQYRIANDVAYVLRITPKK